MLVDAILPLILRAWLEDHPQCPVGDRGGALTDREIAGALERMHAEPVFLLRARPVTAL